MCKLCSSWITKKEMLTLGRVGILKNIFKMDAKLFIFFTFVPYLWFGEAETYCTNANSTEDVYGELGENATLSCTIPRDCVGGIWLHTDTSKWMFQGTQAQNHGYLVSNVYHNNRINNFLHIYNISIDRTGFYSCICQTSKSADVNVEQACINFKIGSPCQMNFSRNDVQNILTSRQRSEVHVHVHDTITTRCAEGLKWKSNCSKDDIDSGSFVVTNVHNNCVITCKRTNKDDQQCNIKVVLKVVEESLDQTSLRNDSISSDYTTMAPQETSIVTDILTVTERLYTSLTTKYKVNTIRSSTDRVSDSVSSIFTTQEDPRRVQSSIILTTSSEDNDVTKLSTEDASSMTRYTNSESSTSLPTTTALVTTTLKGPDESKVSSAEVGYVTTAGTSLHTSSVRTVASMGYVKTSETFPEYLSASTQVKNDGHSTTTTKSQSETTLSNGYNSSQVTSTKIMNTPHTTYAHLVLIIIIQTLLLIIMCFIVLLLLRKVFKKKSMRGSLEKGSWLNPIYESISLFRRFERSCQETNNEETAGRRFRLRSLSDNFDSRMNVDSTHLTSFFDVDEAHGPCDNSNVGQSNLYHLVQSNCHFSKVKERSSSIQSLAACLQSNHMKKPLTSRFDFNQRDTESLELHVYDDLR